MRIVLTGGGTGGHIYPLIAVAKKLKEKADKNVELLFMGPFGKLEEEVMKKENIIAKNVISGKFRRYVSFHNVIDFFKIPVGIVQSLWILLLYMPDAVFSKGGYASIPVVIAAWLYRIPIMTHESDAIPGVTNKILGKLADRIAVSYPSVKKYFLDSKVVLTGNPIREEILTGNPADARERFNLTESKPVILVMGGSLGARVINKAIINVLPDLLHKAQIIHQTGEQNFEENEHDAARVGVKVGRRGYLAFPFLDTEQMRDALAVADVVISRAGANSISGIAAMGLPVILIPLINSANNHQQMNAYEVAEIGGAVVLEEANLGESILMNKIDKLLNDPELRSDMINEVKVFYHPDAADKIVDGIIKMIS